MLLLCTWLRSSYPIHGTSTCVTVFVFLFWIFLFKQKNVVTRNRKWHGFIVLCLLKVHTTKHNSMVKNNAKTSSVWSCKKFSFDNATCEIKIDLTFCINSHICLEMAWNASKGTLKVSCFSKQNNKCIRSFHRQTVRDNLP